MKKKTRPRIRRVPRPILAMAAAPPDHPVVSIDRLKGGEVNWSLRVPGHSAAAAITRAIAEARRLIIECQGLETLERNLRAAAVQERLAESVKQEQEKKKNGQEGGK